VRWRQKAHDGEEWAPVVKEVNALKRIAEINNNPTDQHQYFKSQCKTISAVKTASLNFTLLTPPCYRNLQYGIPLWMQLLPNYFLNAFKCAE
jgi:hypothetical protein